MAEAPLVMHTVVNDVATLTLQNGDKPNVLSQPLQRVLLAELQRVQEDRSVRALVLTGRGTSFCVGADLREMQDVAASGRSVSEWTVSSMVELTNRIVQTLREMRVPVVCAVNGAAAGAGVGLALAADVVLLARSAYLYLPFMPRLGIVPDMGTTWFLPRGIGRGRSVGLTLLGEKLGAEQAVEWGLAWACSDDRELAGDAAALADRLAMLPKNAALEIRRAYDSSEQNDLAAQLAYEAGRQRELVEQPPFMEGVRAFLEKREPRFHAKARTGGSLQ